LLVANLFISAQASFPRVDGRGNDINHISGCEIVSLCGR
jgi:hypothetical protein